MSYNRTERSAPISDSIQRQEYDSRVEIEKAILNGKVRPIFERLINNNTVRWNDQSSAIIDVSVNNFDNLSSQRDDLVYISLLFNKKSRPAGGDNKLTDTCSEIRIAIQANNLKLVTDCGSAHFSLFPIDKEQLESVITSSIDHPPITNTINQ